MNDTLNRELLEELKGSNFTINKYLGKIAHTWVTKSGADSCLNHFFKVSATTPNTISSNESEREFRWIDKDSYEFTSLQPPILRKLLTKRLFESEWDFIDL